MFTTKEEIINYYNRGEKMRSKFKQKVGYAFLQERLKRRLPLEQLSHDIKIPAFKIEALELGYRKINMCLIAALLKFYKKRLVISLEDIPAEDTPALIGKAYAPTRNTSSSARNTSSSTRDTSSPTGVSSSPARTSLSPATK